MPLLQNSKKSLSRKTAIKFRLTIFLLNKLIFKSFIDLFWWISSFLDHWQGDSIFHPKLKEKLKAILSMSCIRVHVQLTKVYINTNMMMNIHYWQRQLFLFIVTVCSCVYICMTILLYYIYIYIIYIYIYVYILYILPNLKNQGIIQYWPKSALLMKERGPFQFHHLIINQSF